MKPVVLLAALALPTMVALFQDGRLVIAPLGPGLTYKTSTGTFDTLRIRIYYRVLPYDNTAKNWVLPAGTVTNVELFVNGTQYRPNYDYTISGNRIVPKSTNMAAGDAVWIHFDQ